MSPTRRHIRDLSFHHRPASPTHDPNAKLATRPSPAPWADTPYRLITSPHTEIQNHYNSPLVYIASEMANIHNVILRGLNSILQQGPHVPDASLPGYNLQDAKDFIVYVDSWCKVIEHHLDMEHSIFYPAVESTTGVKFLMDEMDEQHEEFTDDFVALQDYVEKVSDRPYQYRWKTMKSMIDAFAPVLVNHLHDEIDFLLSMGKFSSERLRKCWIETQRIAMAADDDDMMYQILPFMLGNSDKTYEGGNEFPALSKSVRYAVKYRFSKKHHGAWRFTSCSLSRKPMPLRMLPENRTVE